MSASTGVVGSTLAQAACGGDSRGVRVALSAPAPARSTVDRQLTMIERELGEVVHGGR